MKQRKVSKNKQNKRKKLLNQDKDKVIVCSQDGHEECSHHTHPWKTFDFEQVKNSARFSYLADPFMLRGYSIQKQKKDVFLSLFAWHNETINVWTHLLGGILFIGLFASWYVNATSANPISQLAFDSYGGFGEKMNELALEAKKYSDLLSQEAETFQNQNRLFAQTVALKLSQFPSEVREEVFRQKDAFDNWISEERRLVELGLKTLEKRGGEWLKRTAIVEWLSVHALSEDNLDMDRLTQNLKEKLESFIPKDFEARRAAAALRGWLEEEKRTIESLLFRFDPQSTSIPIWPLLVYCFGSFMCLGCSAVYHWWVGYCRHTHDMLCRVDLAGISFMIWGSGVPLVYYVFYEYPFWQSLYLIGMTVLFFITLYITAFPAQIVIRVRLMAYYAAATFVIAPLIHSIFKWGLYSDQVRRYVNDGYLGVVGLLYIFGTFFYVSRFPEKSFPGYFDFFLASHQIWHLTVFAAAYVHYFGAVELYLWRVETELHSTIINVNASDLVAQ